MATIHPIINEGKRGCGYRKEGGLYLMSGEFSAPCSRLPIPLTVCPTCHAGIKPSRGWTWIDPSVIVPTGGVDDQDIGYTLSEFCGNAGCEFCPVSHPPEGQHGLLWIGERYYATPEDFMREGAAMGISRRLTAIPKDLEIGKTWVYCAHRKAIPYAASEIMDPTHPTEGEPTPGIFTVFKPTHIEYIVKEEDDDEKLKRLDKRGVKLIRLVRQDPQGELIPSSNGLAKCST